MKIEHISRVIFAAEHVTNQQIRRLNQQDRKLLMLCCEALQNQRKLEALNGKQYLVERLITRLTLPFHPQKLNFIQRIYQIFISLFKNIGNILHLRIGQERMNKNVHATYVKSFVTPIDPVFREMLQECMTRSKIPEMHYKLIIETIEKCVLLSIHEPHIRALYNPRYYANQDAARYIYHKTGFDLGDNIRRETLELIQKAPQLLKDKFVEAKRSKTLDKFFEDAFNVADQSLEDRYQRLLKFGNKDWDAAWNRAHPQIRDDAEGVDVKKIDFSENIKFDAFMKLHEAFIEIQMHKYAEDTLYAANEPWQKIKDNIFLAPEFRDNYATDEKFKIFLLSEKIEGRETLEGKITADDVNEQIKNFVNMDMLAKKVIQPFNFDGFGIQVNDFGLRGQNNVQKEVEKLLNEKRINEFTGPYQEITDDLHNHRHKLSNKNLQAARNLIEACLKVSLYKQELMDHIKKQQGMGGWEFTQKLLNGLVLHTEHSFKENEQVILQATNMLLDAYRAYKKANKLVDFFNEINNTHGNACIEGRLRSLTDHRLNKKLIDQKATLEDLLAPKPTPLVSKKETKEKNIQRMLEEFTDVQARKFHIAQGKVIDETWLKTGKNTPKFNIINGENDFSEKYLNGVNFILYLRDEVKCVGKEAQDGKFTQDDLYKFAKMYMDLETLGNADLSLIPPQISKEDTKAQTLGKLNEYFADRQARQYAKEKNIPIGDEWQKSEGGRDKVLEKEDFKEKYNQKNFIEFLTKEIKIVDQMTSEGKIAEAELAELTNKFFIKD